MTTARRLALTLAGTLAVVLGAVSTAVAETPAGWEQRPDPRSTLENLLYFGGLTIGLFVVVALLGLLTARNNYVPPEPGTDIERSRESAPPTH